MTVDTVRPAEELCKYSALAGGDAAGKQQHHHKRASLIQTTVNLIVAGLGSGILSLPWAVAGASVLPSVATTVVVMILNVGTVMILVRAAERYQAFDLGVLLRNLPYGWGKPVQRGVNATTWASIFLCLISYVVVVADALEPFACEFLGYERLAGVATCGLRGSSRWAIRAPLLVFGCLAALPLCFLDQRHLSFSSTLGIIMNIYMLLVVFALLVGGGTKPDCCVAGASAGTVTMFGAVMQCSIIQMCVLPMYEELEDRTPRRFFIATASAFGFLAVLFAIFSSAAYLAIGPGVQPNVIQDFPWDMRGRVARVGVMIAVLVAYPLLHMSMIAPVRHWEEARRGGDHQLSCLVTLLIVIGSGCGAAVFDKLGPLNTINGSIQVGCFIGSVPGLTGLYLLGRESAAWRWLMYTLIVLSVLAAALGLMYTTTDPQGLADGCWWTTEGH